MPRTKPDIDRQQKQEEVVTAARGLLLRDGYDATTVSRIAKQAGVAPNTLYWYFDDKDAVLAAVLDSLLHEGLREFDERKKKSSLQAQLMWLLGLLSDLEGLIGTLHARVAVSDTLRAWHDGFHVLAESMIVVQLRERGLTPKHEADAARTLMFVLEGLLAHPVPEKDKRRLVKWLVAVVQGE